MFRKLVPQSNNKINANSWLAKNFDKLKVFRTLSLLFNAVNAGELREQPRILGNFPGYTLKSQPFELSSLGFDFIKDILVRNAVNYFNNRLTDINSTEFIYLENKLDQKKYPAGIIFKTNIHEYEYYFSWLDLHKDLGENVLKKITDILSNYFKVMILLVDIQRIKIKDLTERDYWRLPPEEASSLKRTIIENYGYDGTFELLEIKFPKYFSANDSHSHDFQELLLLNHNIFSEEMILEIGCGATAINLLHALKLGAKGVIGTEISRLNVVMAQANVQYAQDTGQLAELSTDQVKISLTDTIDENLPAKVILFNAPGVASAQSNKDSFHTYNIPADIYSGLFTKIKKIVKRHNAQGLMRINLHYDCGLVPDLSDSLNVPKYILEYKYGKDLEQIPGYLKKILKIQPNKNKFHFRQGFIGRMYKVANGFNSATEKEELYEYIDFLENIANYENVYNRAKYYIGLNGLIAEQFFWQYRYKDLFLLKKK